MYYARESTVSEMVLDYAPKSQIQDCKGRDAARARAADANVQLSRV